MSKKVHEIMTNNYYVHVTVLPRNKRNREKYDEMDIEGTLKEHIS